MIVANTTQWKIGVAALVPRCSFAAKQALRRRMQAAFERSQEVVPVRTGALQASGTITENDSLLNLEIEISYGGGSVDYAGWVEIFSPYLEPSVVGEAAAFDEEGDQLEGPFD